MHGIAFMKLTELQRIIFGRRRSLPTLAALAVLLYGVPGYAQRGAPGGRAPNPNPFSGKPEAVAEGRAVYEQSCTACHGKDGAAGELGPALGAPARRYLQRTDQAIFDAILKGIAGTKMPPTPLAETDAWKVAAYIMALRGTAIDAPAPGDVARGEQIFWGKGQCGDCHMIRGKGGLLGPDLSNLARARKINSIVDALTKEQHRVATDGGTHDAELLPLSTYQAVRVTMQDGRAITGVLRNEDSFSLQLLGSDNQLYMLDRASLKEIHYEPKSLMPADYDKRLTPEEFQNLLAFLTRQSAAPPEGPGRGGRGQGVE
jgi:putative heme-binding domain-containing protein